MHVAARVSVDRSQVEKLASVSDLPAQAQPGDDCSEFQSQVYRETHSLVGVKGEFVKGDTAHRKLDSSSDY